MALAVVAAAANDDDVAFESHLICIISLPHFNIQSSVYTSQDMEKDNKSLPMRVFPNTMTSFPTSIDTNAAAVAASSASNTMTTSLMQSSSHRHTIHHHHPRITDVQICTNEIIDLTSASTKDMLPVNLNAKARSYELTKINNNMMSIYDVNKQNGSFKEGCGSVGGGGGGSKSSVVNNLDILQGISKGKKHKLIF